MIQNDRGGIPRIMSTYTEQAIDILYRPLSRILSWEWVIQESIVCELESKLLFALKIYGIKNECQGVRLLGMLYMNYKFLVIKLCDSSYVICLTLHAIEDNLSP